MSNEEIIAWCNKRIEQLEKTIENEHPDTIDKALLQHRMGSIMAYEDILTILDKEN